MFRAVDDPTTILVVMEYPSREAALGFLGNPVLKAAMHSAGVIGEPIAVLGEALSAAAGLTAWLEPGASRPACVNTQAEFPGSEWTSERDGNQPRSHLLAVPFQTD